jgi:hypothetical protein
MKINFKLNKNIVNIKAVIAIYIFISLLSTPIYIVYAQVMTSTTYKLQSDSVNFGGARSNSTSYKTEDTIGEVSTGNITGTSYNASIGYQQADISTSGGSNNGGGNSGGNNEGSDTKTDFASSRSTHVRFPSFVQLSAEQQFTDPRESAMRSRGSMGKLGTSPFGISFVGVPYQNRWMLARWANHTPGLLPQDAFEAIAKSPRHGLLCKLGHEIRGLVESVVWKCQDRLQHFAVLLRKISVKNRRGKHALQLLLDGSHLRIQEIPGCTLVAQHSLKLGNSKPLCVNLLPKEFDIFQVARRKVWYSSRSDKVLLTSIVCETDCFLV